MLGELRVSGGKRRSEREKLQVATSENLFEPPTAHQHAGGKGASGKGYHGNTIQCIIKERELQLGIHPCTVPSPALI